MGGSISKALNILLTGFLQPCRRSSLWNKRLLIGVDITKGASESDVQTGEFLCVILFSVFAAFPSRALHFRPEVGKLSYLAPQSAAFSKLSSLAAFLISSFSRLMSLESSFSEPSPASTPYLAAIISLTDKPVFLWKKDIDMQSELSYISPVRKQCLSKQTR